MAHSRAYLSLKKAAESLGVDVFGVADMRGTDDTCSLKPSVMEGFIRAVVIGMRVSSGILDDIDDHPTKLYFHHYRTLNALLDQTALRLAHLIMHKGFDAVAIPASQILDWEHQRAHLSHKKTGLRAGIGWIGRNNLLVNKKYGSQFRMATILTNMPLTPDTPSKQDCGSCRLCVKSCPASAIKDDPSDFDHMACFRQLKEFQRQKYVEQYICGICVKACKGSGK